MALNWGGSVMLRCEPITLVGTMAKFSVYRGEHLLRGWWLPGVNQTVTIIFGFIENCVL